jgi:hypothetical protein
VEGYWLGQVRSIEEAIDWLKRAPYDGGIFEALQDRPEASQRIQN